MSFFGSVKLIRPFWSCRRVILRRLCRIGRRLALELLVFHWWCFCRLRVRDGMLATWTYCHLSLTSRLIWWTLVSYSSGSSGCSVANLSSSHYLAVTPLSMLDHSQTLPMNPDTCSCHQAEVSQCLLGFHHKAIDTIYRRWCDHSSCSFLMNQG